MPEKINILGAGLVGSLLSSMLSKRGFDVHVYEKRNDPRRLKYVNGRSINLALSHRGIKSLKLAGIYDSILPLLVPMRGRMIRISKPMEKRINTLILSHVPHSMMRS
jgi:kynurenine 3-monooxygenase